MFLAGAQNIEAKKEFINELNVFPVPDGDTGTNMSLTIMAAAKEVTALQNRKRKILQKQFLPVRCAAQEVTQELFYLSFCVDSRKQSVRRKKSMRSLLQRHVTEPERLRTRQL